jgi:hypothetical protein
MDKGSKQKIEGQLDSDADEVPVGWLLRADKSRAKGVKDDLKCANEGGRLEMR